MNDNINNIKYKDYLLFSEEPSNLSLELDNIPRKLSNNNISRQNRESTIIQNRDLKMTDIMVQMRTT